uniref:Uncharacterized protein n=1 Tax=Arundo donax TaxID=35708 RepID=A0A0A9AQI5_ARUDO
MKTVGFTISFSILQSSLKLMLLSC